jgi:hypothetical protein
MIRIIVMGLLFIVNNAFCQDIKTIGDNYIAKLGGLENLKKIQNISIEQVGFSNNYEMPQTITIVKDKSTYQETTFPNGKYIIAINNNKGWEINPFVSTKSRDLTTGEVDRYSANINIFGSLYDYHINGANSKVKEITIDGEKEIDKDKCFQLKITYKNNITELMYVSQKTYMVRKVENSMGTIVFSNYKKVNNVMFPFNSEMKNKLGTMMVDVVKLKINTVVSASLFEKN